MKPFTDGADLCSVAQESGCACALYNGAYTVDDPCRTRILQWSPSLNERMEQRKRKISVEGPPVEEEDEVIGPLPAGGGSGTKRRKGRTLTWREF